MKLRLFLLLIISMFLPLTGTLTYAELKLGNPLPSSIIPELKLKTGIQTETLLSPDEAFIPSIKIEDNDQSKIRIDWSIHPDYYLYKNKISVGTANRNIQIKTIDLPTGKEHYDEFFGAQEIYDADFSITLSFNDDLEKIRELYLNIEAQGCAKEGLCFAPYQWNLPILLNPELIPESQELILSQEKTEPNKPVAEHDRLTRFLLQKQYIALPLFFFFGLLLAFTPCVLPMLPILSGILTGKHNLSARHGFLISLVYVLAMAAVYTAFGILAASTGKALAAALQHPYVLITFSLLFVCLSLSMFGLYNLQMPVALQNKLNRLGNASQGTFYHAAILGALSALIVGPCVTAPLIGIIGVIAQSQNYLLGGSALFVMSLGMGVPLLILGLSSGHLLPKAGQWMNQIKIFFGFVLLAVAAYFLGRIMPVFWENNLYAGLAFLTGSWFIYITLIQKNVHKIFLLATLCLFISSIYFIQEANRPVNTYSFTPIKSIAGLNTALKNNHNNITLLEFSADWCVSCKEMEKYVFSHPEVKDRLKHFNALVADVTNNDEDDQMLQKHFKIYGPPVLLFFNTQGEELPEYRVMGAVSANTLMNHLDSILETYSK